MTSEQHINAIIRGDFGNLELARISKKAYTQCVTEAQGNHEGLLSALAHTLKKTKNNLDLPLSTIELEANLYDECIKTGSHSEFKLESFYPFVPKNTYYTCWKCGLITPVYYDQ